MRDVTDELLVDGVEQFEGAMSRLLAGIAEHRAAIATGRPPTIEARLSTELEGPVAARVKQAITEDVARRIWRRTRRCGAVRACRRSTIASAG